MSVTLLRLACTGKQDINQRWPWQYTGFCGGQDMIAGLLDHITERHPGSTLLDFKKGNGGILAKDHAETTQASVGLSV